MRLVKIGRVALLLLLVSFIVLLVSARRGGGVAPVALAVVALVLAAVASALACAAAWRLFLDPRHRLSAACEALLAVGLLVASGAGLANWARGLSGFVVLTEGEAVEASQLSGVAAGPFASAAGLASRLKLAKVDLISDGGGGFEPESLLVLERPGAPPEEIRTSSARGASAGSFLFFQGAFGFAPRLVVRKDGRTILDRTVHFASRREGERGVAFEADVPIAEEGVAISAAVDLRDLDERMKGHPELSIEVRRGAEVLGAGRLLPGHGAAMRDGWDVSFAGLKMWSEIDVSRKSYRAPLLFGLVLALAGAIGWPLAAWRRP